MDAGPTSPHDRGALHEAEARFRSAFEETGVGMAIVGLDGRFLRVNRELARLLGRTERELLDGAGIPDVSHPDDLSARLGDFGRLAAGELARYKRDRRYRHADGHALWGATTITLVRDDAGRPLYAIGQLEDITGRKVAEARAERRAAQQAAVVRLSRLALDETDLDTLGQATVVAVRETLDVALVSLARLLPGADADVLQLVSAAGADLEAEMHVDAAHAAHALATGGPVVVDDCAGEARFDVAELAARGLASGVCLPVEGERAAAPLGVLGLYAGGPRAFDEDDLLFLESVANVLTSVARRLAAEGEARHRALHDPLTQLPNRALLLDRLRHGLARARRGDRWLALLHLDLDHFKNLNDAHGHATGDALLRDLAPRISEVLRPSDTLARVGGDEFAIVCDGLTDPTESATVAARVLDVVAMPSGPAGGLRPAASVGIALAAPGAAATAEDLLRDADVALYRAKAAGRGRYELFDDRMRQETDERIQLTADLRRAIERGELRLEFQPVVSFGGRRVVGVEALARWTHPERGEIAPGRFIPLAEQHGLIAPLGGWVVRAALDQIAAWRAGGDAVADLTLSVNVSRVQLGSPGLAPEVLEAIRERDIAPRRLVVEVTESAVMDDPGAATATLEALHEGGVLLALDDFGVGQSSLACLRDLPLDVLKLDRGFITSLATSREAAAIVRAVADMARTLRFPVVAEGIEHDAQATVVEALGCELGQGFLYARPCAPEELPAVVAALDARLRGPGAARRR